MLVLSQSVALAPCFHFLGQQRTLRVRTKLSNIPSFQSFRFGVFTMLAFGCSAADCSRDSDMPTTHQLNTSPGASGKPMKTDLRPSPGHLIGLSALEHESSDESPESPCPQTKGPASRTALKQITGLSDPDQG